MKTKAHIDLGKYKANAIVPVALAIHKAMGDNAGTFTSPAISLIALKTQIDDTAAKFILRASGSKQAIVDFAASRTALLNTLRVQGNYVNGVAQGDPAIVVQSGFPSYETGHPADPSAPPAPTDLHLRLGDVSGSMKVYFKPHRKNTLHEVQTNIVDPIHDADWHNRGMFKSSRVTLDGFTPGGLVWVRVRTAGLKGVMGDWSDIAQIRLL